MTRFLSASHPNRLPVLSGILVVLSHYFGLLVPNFVAFVPMLFWIDAHRERSVQERLRGGIVFGLAAYGLGLHWIYAMLSISFLAAFMYLALVVLFTAGAAIAFALVGTCRRWTGWPCGVLLPLCWIPLEWSRTWGDLRMTADHVGHSLARFPFLIQFDDVVGPYGVGAFLLATNGLLYDAITGRGQRRGRRAAFFLALLVLSVLAYDGWAWTHPPPEVGRIRVAAIQPNVSLEVKHDPAQENAEEEKLTRLTLQAARARPDLIVWPESARPHSLAHWLDNPATFAMPDVQRLAVETGATILTGVAYLRIRGPEDYDAYNAALVVHPDGRLDPAWTAKVYLVPFTEGVPFRLLLGPFLEGLTGPLHWLSGGFTPGPKASLLPAAGVKVGVLVCYEELYSDLSRSLRNAGADLQVVITNDVWYGRTVFQDFVADVVRMRAIETRSSVVRVANTGISGFVDPLGRYRHRTGLYVEAAEVEDVPIVRVETIYARIGDAPAWFAIVGLAVAVTTTSVRRRRAKKNGGVSTPPLDRRGEVSGD